MKKVLAAAVFGLAAFGPAADRASAWCHHDCCKTTICCKPYNAFSPCCCPCAMPCGNWSPCGGPCGCGDGCAQPYCAPAPWDGGACCGGGDGCLGPIDVVGHGTPASVRAAFGCGHQSHQPWWAGFGKHGCGGDGCAEGCPAADDGHGHRLKLFHHHKAEAPADCWGPATGADCGCQAGPWGDGGNVVPAPASPPRVAPVPAPRPKQAEAPAGGVPDLTTIQMDPITTAWPLPR